MIQRRWGTKAITDNIEEHWVIKADPGWMLVSYYIGLDHEGKTSRLFYEDIVAWEITREEGPINRRVAEEQPNLRGCTIIHRNVDPLIVSGHPDDISNRLWAVKTPSGRIDTGDSWFETDEDFLTYAKEEEERMQETEKRTGKKEYLR